ncbi:MAG: hypothetical protein J0H19_01425 [Rhodospirillales bacterium]|nr:hypothetical protein [Rhodospirillales bacterium]
MRSSPFRNAVAARSCCRGLRIILRSA